MALVEMTSNLSQINTNFSSTADASQNLSQINTNFSSNTTTAGNTARFPYNSLNESNFPRTLFLDSKGDSSPVFSETNRANNVFNLGDSPTPIQNRLTRALRGDGTVASSLLNKVGGKLDGTFASSTITGLFNYSATRPRSSFIPPNNINNRFPIDTIDIGTRPEYSRLYRKHTENNFLDNYYARAGVSNDQLGIRNDRLNANNQPYIIKKPGDKWGSDIPGFNDILPKLSDTILRTSLSGTLKGQWGLGAVSSRSKNVFEDRYKADVRRLKPFVDSGILGFGDSLFIQRQKDLQRQNPFTGVTTVRYGLSDIDTGNPILDIFANTFSALSTTPLGNMVALNPQVYNPKSVYSVPGVSGMMYNRIGTNAAGLLDGSQLANIGEEAVGIIKNIGMRALELSAPAIVQGAGEFLKKGLGNLGSKLENANISFGRKNADGERPNKKLREIFKGGGDKFKFANEKRKQAGLLFGFEKGAAGKGSLRGLDPTAFEDLNVDKINLIPYGEDSYKDVSYDKLDWIPFKFVDARNDKPIVFRAILSGISDTFSPAYTETRFVGRPDNVYVYGGTDRSISFTFEVYPKSDSELPQLWKKLNYLAGLTYPHLTTNKQGMVAPFAKLTIGDMYKDAPGIIRGLTYTVMDETTWETEFVKLPKYMQVQCEFQYIGNLLPQAEQAVYDYDFIPSLMAQPGNGFIDNAAKALLERGGSLLNKVGGRAGQAAGAVARGAGSARDSVGAFFTREGGGGDIVDDVGMDDMV